MGHYPHFSLPVRRSRGFASTASNSFRAIFARAPGLPPTGQTYPTPRNSVLPSTGLPVLLDQRFAIDPWLLGGKGLATFAGESVISRPFWYGSRTRDSQIISLMLYPLS
jgi:hypothetical protein